MRSVYVPRVTPMRRARRLKRWTIPEAAAACGTSPETYRRWEQGLQRPKSPRTVERVLGMEGQ